MANLNDRLFIISIPCAKRSNNLGASTNTYSCCLVCNDYCNRRIKADLHAIASLHADLLV
jgi:hypothetical protein